jgi:hypothetical protein
MWQNLAVFRAIGIVEGRVYQAVDDALRECPE